MGESQIFLFPKHYQGSLPQRWERTDPSPSILHYETPAPQVEISGLFHDSSDVVTFSVTLNFIARVETYLPHIQMFLQETLRKFSTTDLIK